MILSVDPGISGSGAALWKVSTGELVKAGYVKPLEVPSESDTDGEDGRPGRALPPVPTLAERWRAMAGALAMWCRPAPAHAVVIELPRVYTASKSKGSPDDLVKLAGLVGAVCYAINGRRAHTYYPHDWKGSVPKEVTEARARKRLSAEETGRIVFPAPSLRHNVWDAIGIGLHHLARLGVRQ